MISIWKKSGFLCCCVDEGIVDGYLMKCGLFWQQFMLLGQVPCPMLLFSKSWALVRGEDSQSSKQSQPLNTLCLGLVSVARCVARSLHV